jgi:hypothetical protein
VRWTRRLAPLRAAEDSTGGIIAELLDLFEEILVCPGSKICLITKHTSWQSQNHREIRSHRTTIVNGDTPLAAQSGDLSGREDLSAVRNFGLVKDERDTGKVTLDAHLEEACFDNSQTGHCGARMPGQDHRVVVAIERQGLLTNGL